MRTLTRFRLDPFFSLVTAAVLTSFISGAAVGVLATRPAVAQPAQVIPCASAADPIACLIMEADEEASEPPQ